jgi:hypothetical protein
MATNRQLIQTVNVMSADGSERKLKVLDPEGIPDGTELFRVSKRGEVLPKGSKKHEPKHLWTIKTFVTSKNDKLEKFQARFFSFCFSFVFFSAGLSCGTVLRDCQFFFVFLLFFFLRDCPAGLSYGLSNFFLRARFFSHPLRLGDPQ